MSIKWTKIRNQIINGKLNEINESFLKIQENVVIAPRTKWVEPIKCWTNKQIKSLSLEEYTKLHKLVQQMHESFTSSVAYEPIFEDEFKQTYLEIIVSKEQELKLQVVAELVEENNLPLHILVDWYLDHQDLPPEQFNEALGEFWGDVWKHAKHGAGVGALAGAAGGSLGGIGGTFAGAGLGGLVGGLYGGGKHLLKQVWGYRKNQVEFDKTKEKAIEILNKLKDQSKNFEFDANFRKLLDTVIEKLGTAKAYRAAISPPPTPEPVHAPEPVAQPMSEPEHEPELSVPSSEQPAYVPEIPPEEEEESPIEQPAVFNPKPKRGRKAVYKVAETEKKFEEVKNMHDLMNYMESHAKELPVLGLALDMLGWEPHEDIDKLSFEDLYKEIESFKDAYNNMEPIEEAHHHRELAKQYLEKLKSVFGVSNSVGTGAVESYQSIKNKYLSLIKER